MTETISLENKVELITEWIESESVQQHAKADWIGESWAFAVEEYNDSNIKSVITTTIAQIAKASKRYQIEDYPLGSRSSSNMTPAMTELIKSHGDFLDLMVQAFESLPENHVIHSKKSTARPDRRYANAADWRKHWTDIITSNVKTAQKETTQ